jgi:hypothetical protein
MSQAMCHAKCERFGTPDLLLYIHKQTHFCTVFDPFLPHITLRQQCGIEKMIMIMGLLAPILVLNSLVELPFTSAEIH